jgi:hypothetical protein
MSTIENEDEIIIAGLHMHGLISDVVYIRPIYICIRGINTCKLIFRVHVMLKKHGKAWV